MTCCTPRAKSTPPPAAGFVSMFKEMKKSTVELNLEPSRNQDQFDLSIHKLATVAVEEFKNSIIKKNKKNNRT